MAEREMQQNTGDHLKDRQKIRHIQTPWLGGRVK
jgi:hypothetical protein